MDGHADVRQVGLDGNFPIGPGIGPGCWQVSRKANHLPEGIGPSGTPIGPQDLHNIRLLYKTEGPLCINLEAH